MTTATTTRPMTEDDALAGGGGGSTADLFLTRVVLDTRHRQVRRDLPDASSMHRTVMSMYDDVDSATPRAALGVLYRVDSTNTSVSLLVQSQVEANLAALPEGYGDARQISLAPLLGRLEPGRVVRYRILANATKKVNSGDQRGKRIALGRDETLAWWQKRAESSGLDLIHEPTLTSSLAADRGKESRLVLRPWTIDGVARVTNTEALIGAMREGLGRGKAYGCGLLSIALG